MDSRERYEDVVTLYYDRIKRYLSLKIDIQTAEDLTQLTFIKAYENFHSFNGNASIFTWLVSIANNNLKNEYRKKHRQFEASDTPNLHQFVSFEFTKNIELRIDITEALRCLNERDREIISLYYGGGFTLLEVSEMIEMKLSAVKNRLYRALKKLKAHVHYEEGMAMPSAIQFIDLISKDTQSDSSTENKKMYQTIIDHLSFKIDQICKDLHYEPTNKITIEIYESLQAFHQAVGEPDAPNWFMGVTEGNTIKIASPLQPGPEHTYESILKSTVHLFTINIIQNINPDAHKWIYQGLGGYNAQLMTEGYIHDSIAPFVMQNQIPSFEELSDNSWEYGTKKGFQFSYTLVEFVLKQYGIDALNTLIRKPASYEEALGCSSSKLHQRWTEVLIDRFNAN